MKKKTNKNMVVILIVISVIGVVVYLSKNRLKVLLGERVERERTRAAEIISRGQEGTHPLPPIGAGWLGLNRLYGP